MTDKIPAILSWSGGKDCAYALHVLLQEDKYEVKYLLSVFNEATHALNMHRVPEALIDHQAAATGIPLLKVFVSDSSNSSYEKQLAEAIEKVKAENIDHIIFGDLFLQDLRQYREASMHQLGMTCVFPLWQMPSDFLINDFIAKGFKAMSCCVDAAKLQKSFAGREINDAFVTALPPGIDPCGENGEYHSFCYDAPYFKKPVKIEHGQVYFKPLELKMTDKEQSLVQGYWFCELLPAGKSTREKICPKCAQPFECMQDDIKNCHCYTVAISAEVREDITNRYQDCLCHNCLTEAANVFPLKGA